jgi:hypothetical protein
MIEENQFSDKQRELYELMCDISEDATFAGWISGNEYYLYSALLQNSLTYGMCDIDRDDLNRLRELSEDVDGWVIWFDDSNDAGLPTEKCGPRFVTMDEWNKMYEEWIIRNKSK